MEKVVEYAEKVNKIHLVKKQILIKFIFNKADKLDNIKLNYAPVENVNSLYLLDKEDQNKIDITKYSIIQGELYLHNIDIKNQKSW